jgi:hypothetical protein
MEARPVIARAGLDVWLKMEAVPVNIAASWTWARRITTAPPHTITNHNNQNDSKHKYMMPNINNAKSSKSPNSDIGNSPSNMKSKIINYIRAGYPGLYLVSAEEQRVALEMTRIAQELK